MVHVCKKLQSGCRTGWMLLLAAAMLIVSAPVLAQQRATVTGTVTDQSGQPVIGATVIEQGTTNGATTGVDGTYTLKLKGGGNSANLIFQSLADGRSERPHEGGRETQRRRRGPRRRGGDRLRYGQTKGPHDGCVDCQDRRPRAPSDHLGFRSFAGQGRRCAGHPTAWCSSPPSRAAGRWDPRSRSRPSSASRR